MLHESYHKHHKMHVKKSQQAQLKAHMVRYYPQGNGGPHKATTSLEESWEFPPPVGTVNNSAGEEPTRQFQAMLQATKTESVP